MVRVQKPVRLANDSQTKPDITLLSRRNRGSAYPTAADVLLLIEVSDTLLAYDQDVKVPLYAAASIPEVWITDLKGGRIVRFSDPREGRYEVVAQARRGETIPPSQNGGPTSSRGSAASASTSSSRSRVGGGRGRCE